MSLLGDYTRYLGTNAGVSPVANAPAILILGALSAGTMNPTQAVNFADSRPRLEQTSAGRTAVVQAEAEVSRATDVNRLRQLSGLTWEQLAQMLGTSRRSIHSWASGARLSAANQERVARALATIEAISNGSAGNTRVLLLSSVGGGKLLLDLLGAQKFEEARLAAGRLGAIERGPATETTQPSSQPWSVAYLDALQDTAHQEPTKVRAVRAVRIKPAV